MSDTHQAIYDAVRSKISGGDISSVVRDVLWQQMDISHLKAMIQGDAAAIGWEMQRPSVLFRPTLLQDGNTWLAIYGDLPTTYIPAMTPGQLRIFKELSSSGISAHERYAIAVRSTKI